MSVQLTHHIPMPEDYCALRKVCGLSEKSLEAAVIGLQHAWHTVTLYDDTQLIGMGRIIGDGATAFQIIDIAVHPHYQGHGYAKQIMQDIMNYIYNIKLPGTYVSLIADHPAENLYAQFGFRLTEPLSRGMSYHYKYHS